MTDIVERLLDFTTRDHERGCTGREYVCSCGYDDEIDARHKEAAAEIEHLRLSISEAHATGRREGLSEAARIADGMIVDAPEDERPGDEDWRCRMVANQHASSFAAAIRAAMEKEKSE